jgi:hypothetical protein
MACQSSSQMRTALLRLPIIKSGRWEEAASSTSPQSLALASVAVMVFTRRRFKVDRLAVTIVRDYERLCQARMHRQTSALKAATAPYALCPPRTATSRR